VTVKLDPAMVEWLDDAAAVRDIDRSECLRRLIAATMAAQSPSRR
jgi:predicted transcriptional regulator